MTEFEFQFDPKKVVPLPCKAPPTKSGCVLTSHECKTINVLSLGHDCHVLIFQNVLTPPQRDDYLKQAAKVPRKSDRSGFGQHPRRELCYSPSGQPNAYSSVACPSHVLEVREMCEKLVNDRVRMIRFLPSENPFTEVATAVDMLYDDTFLRGGSISAHSDDEGNYGAVSIFSLGQTRYLRIRSLTYGTFYNVALADNSLVVMFGRKFQTKFTHQIDKLKSGELVGVRLSLKFCYTLP